MKTLIVTTCSLLIATAGFAGAANAHPRGWHRHCHWTMVHHHKVRRCN